MKHLGFTIQFVLLLIAIPVLMYVELTRDDKKQPKEETTTQVEVAFVKKAPPLNMINIGLLN